MGTGVREQSGSPSAIGSARALSISELCGGPSPLPFLSAIASFLKVQLHGLAVESERDGKNGGVRTRGQFRPATPLLPTQRVGSSPNSSQHFKPSTDDLTAVRRDQIPSLMTWKLLEGSRTASYLFPVPSVIKSHADSLQCSG
ncbi:hypothetical protein TREES_T100000802 [Tupaia chinensis]|uniref:Uncharacterized protein n=1 Tax=Tupaia chinensis TaxID=246437 RepID=L9KBD1_TUPCH|nr:hypothetical protein TREES_T100000802 [Tupaia chinensis]